MFTSVQNVCSSEDLETPYMPITRRNHEQNGAESYSGILHSPEDGHTGAQHTSVGDLTNTRSRKKTKDMYKMVPPI